MKNLQDWKVRSNRMHTFLCHGVEMEYGRFHARITIMLGVQGCPRWNVACVACKSSLSMQAHVLVLPIPTLRCPGVVIRQRLALSTDSLASLVSKRGDAAHQLRTVCRYRQVLQVLLILLWEQITHCCQDRQVLKV